MNEEETHECTACHCEFSEDEGGVRGYFGMLSMAFCPTCYACIWDMVDQQREWVGLTDQDMNEPKTHNLDFILGARWAEEILKERNK